MVVISKVARIDKLLNTTADWCVILLMQYGLPTPLIGFRCLHWQFVLLLSVWNIEISL